MLKLQTLLLALLISLSGNAFQEASNGVTPSDKAHILFIGNSLTYYNDLPKLVKKEAKRKGVKVTTKMVAHPNYAIMDHWNDGEIQKLIRTKKYDYVIVQQGPSSQKEGKELLIDYGKKLSYLCKNNQAELCFFMVWPSQQYYHTFSKVIANHKEAAKITNAILLPVGEVWKAHFDTTNNLDYYSADRFHPSLKGSKKAAEVIVDHLFKNN